MKQGRKEANHIVSMVNKGMSREAFYIALNHIEKGKPLTLEILNSILSKTNGVITQEEFDRLLSLKFVDVSLPLNKNTDLNGIIGRDLPAGHKDHKANRLAGVYIFTDGQNTYVGCSIHLRRRVRDYYKPSVKGRPVIRRLHGEHGHKFTLSVCIIPNNLRATRKDLTRLTLRFEQYLLLTKSCNLNSLKVSGVPPSLPIREDTKKKLQARMGKPLFLTNVDGSVIYYVSRSGKQLSKDLGINKSRIPTYLDTGKVLYDQFVLTNTKPVNRVIGNLTIKELRSILVEGRRNTLLEQNTKLHRGRYVKSIKCTDTINNSVFIRQSYYQAMKHTRRLGDKTRSVSHEKIIKMSLSPNETYKGWKFECI